jgi:hypothetical protein
MRHSYSVGAAGAVSLATALFVQHGLVQARDTTITADEITQTLQGKLCVSRVGAKFTFSRDGHYAYSGLWDSTGRYSIHDGAIRILLDSGLERDFAISNRNGTIYMENTALSCR